jgi:hypothetical protein
LRRHIEIRRREMGDLQPKFEYGSRQAFVFIIILRLDCRQVLR